MRRVVTVFFIAGCLLAGVAQVASADAVVPGSKVILYDSYGTTAGGEFNGQIVGSDPAFDFISFCLEYNEYFTPGQPLLVNSMTNAAIAGGVSGGALNPVTGVVEDPLRSATEWLFTQFVLDPSSIGYSMGAGRAASADAMQSAIWYLEGEIASVTGQAQTWATMALNAEAAGWKDQGYVTVLNLLRQDASGAFTVKAQDQLYFNRSVPEPGTLFLLGTGLIGLVGMRSRRRKDLVA